MAGVNKVILVGRLGRDPEMKYAGDGKAIANFSIATSETWKDKGSGEKQEKTEWHRLVAFGRLAEICGEYLCKGKEIYIEGRLQTRSWEKDGVTRYATEIVANTMQMLGGRDGQAQNQQQAPKTQGQGYNPEANYQQQQNVPPMPPQSQQQQFGQGVNQPPVSDDIPF